MNRILQEEENEMKNIWKWCKSEIVLCIAILLAIGSSFFVKPDRIYFEYIDFRTLAILFCLMAVMVGLQKVGLFNYVAEKLLGKVKHIRGIVFVLMALCFFSSMLITNDVALITFVPFTFIVLQLVLGERASELVVPVVVMQTIAANLGSMLTPIGNPQNLYLYGKVDMNFGEFISLMLPYTIVAFILLAVWCVTFSYHGEKRKNVQFDNPSSMAGKGKELFLYSILFVVCLLTVADIIPYIITLGIVLLTILFADRKILKEVDYSLLFTFVGFFVFIGNMGRVPEFSELLQRVIEGNELLTAVVSSQFMSNVPAALLLSGFTEEFEQLIIGTNLGGLGTLIASMASLISFKYVGKEYPKLRAKYFWVFTISNILFLVVLFVIGKLMFIKIL